MWVTYEDDVAVAARDSSDPCRSKDPNDCPCVPMPRTLRQQWPQWRDNQQDSLALTQTITQALCITQTLTRVSWWSRGVDVLPIYRRVAELKEKLIEII